VNLIIEPIWFLWNVIFTFYYTRVRPQCDYSILGRNTWSNIWTKNYKLKNQIFNLFQYITNLVLCMCVFFSSSFVCIFACANVYFKTTIIKPNIKIILTAGVPSSQVLPGFLITTPPIVCVSALLGALAVWIQKQNKKTPINHLCYRPSIKGTKLLFIVIKAIIIIIPLQANRFQKSILLIVQYKYWKSCSGDFILQNLILRTRSCVLVLLLNLVGFFISRKKERKKRNFHLTTRSQGNWRPRSVSNLPHPRVNKTK